jgi:hypothetical protein
MRKKTVFFAGAEIVIAHIVGVKAYERNYKSYVQVTTTAGEYIEKFEEEGYSESAKNKHLMSSNADYKKFLESMGQIVTPEMIQKDNEAYADADRRLVEKTIKRRDEILKLL